MGLHRSWKNGRSITGEWSFYVYLESRRFESEEIIICEIVDAYTVSDWICNINFCNKVRKGDGFNPISIKKSLAFIKLV